jgi:hypothetical protein
MMGQPLYKLLKREYAEKAVKQGIFRIGTLYEYQDIEKHGSAKGDIDEGKKYIQNHPDEIYDYSQLGTVPDFVRKFINAKDGMHVKIEGILMREEIKSPDSYLYCVTHEISTKAMKLFESNSVLLINEPKRFFHALSSCLRKKVSIRPGFIISDCVYMCRASHYKSPNPIHPAILKDPSYQYQKEVRVIWEPIKKPLSPIIINCKVAKKFCSILSDKEIDKLIKT